MQFFGPIRALVKTDDWEMDWRAGESLDTFWSRLLGRFPEIETARGGLRLARNGEFLREGEGLRPGDEIALIPPVSGG